MKITAFTKISRAQKLICALESTTYLIYSYLTITSTVSVHSPFSPPSHGRLYSRYIVLEPCFSALKVQTSCPGVPGGGGGSLSGPTNSWFSCCITVASLIWESSDHWKPVLGFEHNFTSNFSPAWTSSVWLM